MQERETILQDALREDCTLAVLYEIYGAQAETEGYTTLAQALRQMGLCKREHARLWLGQLGMAVHTPAALETLLSFAGRERYERYADRVQDGALAARLRQVASCEGEMEDTLLRLLAQVQHVSHHSGSVAWHCCRCGYPYRGETAPLVCPVCQARHSFLEV